MKKILIASDNFLPRWDGVSRFLSEIIPKLSSDYAITVLAPNFGQLQREFQNVKIIRFPTAGFSINAYQPALPKLSVVREEVRKADVVWIQAVGPIGLTALHYAYKQNKPVLAYIHSIEWELASKAIAGNDFLRKIVRSVVKKIATANYSKCDMILVPSLEVEEIFSWMGVRSAKTIVYLGVDTNKFIPPKDRAEAKKALGLDPAKYIIGYHGRIGREKSLITMHRAYLRLARRRKDVELLIVGGGVKSVENLFAKKPGMHFVGYKDDVVKYLQAMDIYVLPSLTETTSLSTMEAMSCAVAPVCTQVGFVKDYIQEGYNGFFFPKENFFALSKVLERLVSHPKLLERIQENARKTIVSSYSWNKTVEKLKAAINHFV